MRSVFYSQNVVGIYNFIVLHYKLFCTYRFYCENITKPIKLRRTLVADLIDTIEGYSIFISPLQERLKELE